METLQTNVVFARLTRHSRWPSLRTTVRLFVAAVLVGMAGAAALLVANLVFFTDIGEVVGEVVVLGSLAVALLSPLVAALVTVITTVTDVQSEAYQLMRVSLLPKEEILSGYLYAALYRLRLLWVLAFGLLSPPVAVLLTGDILLDAYTDGIPITVVLAAPAAWLISMTAGVAFNWLAVCIAVWQSLRWKYVGLAIAAVIVLFTGIEVLGCLALPPVYWMMFGSVVQSGSGVSFICCSVSFFFFFVSISVYGLTKEIREKAKDCI